MSNRISIQVLCWGLWGTGLASLASADDWPQWRGGNRDARVANFQAPESWPAELKSVWKVTVGDGVATPALVAGKLYVFSREGGEEVLRCLDATTGDELWNDRYAAQQIAGAAGSFPGPRASPAVAQGKVVVLGVHGVVTCCEADTGRRLWQHRDTEGDVPRFNTSSSPLIHQDVCLVQLGAGESGGIVALDLTSGAVRWKWTGDGAAYASPTLFTLDDLTAVVAATERKIVAINAADGRLLWAQDYTQGRYNAASPIAADNLLIFAGPNRGATALTVSVAEGKLQVSEAWRNDESTVQFNTPVLRETALFGLSAQDQLFCVNAATGATVWTAPFNPAAPQPPAAPPSGAGERRGGEQGAEGQRGEQGQRGQRGERGGRGGGGRGGGGRAGYGSVVDAGSVLIALNPTGRLVVFAPDETAYQEVATYQVAADGTYAYPIVDGSHIIVKDRDSVILYSVR